MNPKASRPLEYVAFFSFELKTGEGNAHIFLAVDAYLDHAFQLGVERDRKPETVLKNVYELIEHPEFSEHLGNGFTLVLEEFKELSSEIESIIKVSGGKVLYNKALNNVIGNPVLASFLSQLKRK